MPKVNQCEVGCPEILLASVRDRIAVQSEGSDFRRLALAAELGGLSLTRTARCPARYSRARQWQPRPECIEAATASMGGDQLNVAAFTTRERERLALYFPQALPLPEG